MESENFFNLHARTRLYLTSRKGNRLVGKISRPQLDRAPIELVQTFPKLGNQGVSSDMAALISKIGHFYGFS